MLPGQFKVILLPVSTNLDSRGVVRMLVMALTLIQTAITETVRLLNINTLNSKKLNYITKKV